MSHIYCPECGFQNPEAANYCSKCGALLHTPEPAEQTQTFSPDDGGTFFGFSDPDGNSWAVQELRVRAEHPLIPPEARGRFGADS